MRTVNAFAQIQALSNERQQLWRRAGRDKFSAPWWERQRRVKRIGQELERLWHVHRCEIVRPQRRFAKDRVHGDVFSDFVDRLTVAMPLSVDDWDGMSEERLIVPESPRTGAKLPIYQPDAISDFVLTVLCDVVAELKHEDGEQASA